MSPLDSLSPRTRRDEMRANNPRNKNNSPLSVLGSATVTLTVQLSQQISSSPRTAYQAGFRRLRSKNCTSIWPRPLPLPVLGPGWCGWWRSASSWRMSAVVRWSIRVSSSTSATCGRVRSRTSRVWGRMEGKNRWKKMVWRIPKTGCSLRLALRTSSGTMGRDSAWGF